MERNAETKAETTDPDNIPFTYKFNITLLVLNSLKSVTIYRFIYQSHNIKHQSKWPQIVAHYQRLLNVNADLANLPSDKEKKQYENMKDNIIRNFDISVLV